MNLLKKISRFFKKRFPFHSKTSADEIDLTTIQSIIGYRFKDISFLRKALRHRSYTTANGSIPPLDSNERLEFLGDAVLNCCVTEHLFHTYPQKSEGELSKIKSLIVSRKILGEIATELNFGDYILLGHGEKSSGGRKKTSILANVFEAIVGAIFLDGGLEPSQTFLKASLFCRITEFLKEKSNINYKSKILEVSQRDGFGIPHYKVLSTMGPEHAKIFKVQIEIGGVPLGEGSGPNKKTAQQIAAKNALKNYEKSKIVNHSKGAESNELVSD
ncbi:MAG: ribonuclease III [Chitinivibrionales bacterium]|nr:ribonuclease III [Chitinivibrionales bacterium]